MTSTRSSRCDECRNGSGRATGKMEVLVCVKRRD